MVEFNIKKAGNELLKILETKLGSKNTCRLSVDVQIPTRLKGDKQGLYESVVSICEYLNGELTNLLVDIELLKVNEFARFLKLNIDVRGSNGNRTSLELNQKDIDGVLKSLPYPTFCFSSELYVCFSFKMTFETSEDMKNVWSPFENKRILLAEDNEVSALVFISFLEEWGCRVTKVANGLRAVEEARFVQYDLILMDIHMPEKPGHEAIREIREFDQRVPIIALTSSSMKNETSLPYIAGANNIIVKPVNSADLQKILIKYL
jgi:CheY-like chemotaxis protein